MPCAERGVSRLPQMAPHAMTRAFRCSTPLLPSKDAGNHLMGADLLETDRAPNHVETLYRHSRLLLGKGFGCPPLEALGRIRWPSSETHHIGGRRIVVK